jgi:hypothetical protein
VHLLFLTTKFTKNGDISEKRNNREGEKGAEGKKMIRNGVFPYSPSAPLRLNFFKFW